MIQMTAINVDENGLRTNVQSRSEYLYTRFNAVGGVSIFSETADSFSVSWIPKEGATYKIKYTPLDGNTIETAPF